MRTFAAAVYPAQVVAVGTRSSIASLPALLDGAKRKLDVPAPVLGFALPFAVSAFKVNRTISGPLGMMFLAYWYDIDLQATQIVAFVVTVMIMSFSSPGIPKWRRHHENTARLSRGRDSARRRHHDQGGGCHSGYIQDAGQCDRIHDGRGLAWASECATENRRDAAGTGTEPGTREKCGESIDNCKLTISNCQWSHGTHRSHRTDTNWRSGPSGGCGSPIPLEFRNQPMIFLVHKHHRYTIEGYLESRWCQDLAGRIRILSYHDLLRMSELPQDTYIFCDHERLTKQHTDLAISIWRQLEDSGRALRLLNNPAKVLRRYPLLRTLFESGRNAFQAIRATDAWKQVRYPVFVRKADDHAGSLTPLLNSPHEVEQALAELTPRFRSGRSNLLVIEFCDTSAGKGIYQNAPPSGSASTSCRATRPRARTGRSSPPARPRKPPPSWKNGNSSTTIRTRHGFVTSSRSHTSITAASTMAFSTANHRCGKSTRIR